MECVHRMLTTLLFPGPRPRLSTFCLLAPSHPVRHTQAGASRFRAIKSHPTTRGTPSGALHLCSPGPHAAMILTGSCTDGVPNTVPYRYKWQPLDPCGPPGRAEEPGYTWVSPTHPDLNWHSSVTSGPASGLPQMRRHCSHLPCSVLPATLPLFLKELGHRQGLLFTPSTRCPLAWGSLPMRFLQP